ncbi:SDR family NAD(P)-dependent oxidoreductase [Streptomyces sp. NPDC050433]|uniref:SDR family NAD(P)-dependent oxidoreductase n=1 Tax=Streptomyces sp. NPDC050433 TaxID=3365615 RepID=UPI0037AB7FA4
MSRPQPAGTTDEIAVIGLALRFPGAETLEEFLGHLIEGRSLISEVPAERWSKERYFGDPRRGEEKTNSIWGGFVADADRFDAAFFNISPREAETMDPQQRFALELAWGAVEDAGYRASELAGTRTGVFMGVCHADYAELMEHDGARTDAYFPTGTAYSIISNRVSYFLDLHGPSITNDTACSSSLVSVYEAVGALRNGDCDLALAGGVNLCWSPKHFVAFSQASMLSRTGRSRAFDQGADGYVRGEGGAVLLLKPLSRALADRDPVYAVIKGIATNHGGRTNSLTVTNPTAQAELVERLYARTGIRPETVSYIEAHGPGTPLGDPIEIVALKQAFRNLHAAQGTEPEEGTTGVGSVKTNIGHLEGAAGVAGMVKVIAGLAGRVLPATVGFTEQNRMIRLDGSPFTIVRDTRRWAAPAAGPAGAAVPRRAGVSSFGFGGTNAHVVLEEHLDDALGRERSGDRAPGHKAYGPSRTAGEGPYVVPLSARTQERLREAARRLAACVREPEPGDAAAEALRPRRLADIAFTLQTGREAMAARVAFVVADRQQLLSLLGEFADGTLADQGVHARADAAAALLEDAGRWAEGGDADWAMVRALGGYQDARRVRLPAYPFARERHWYRLARPTAPGTAGGGADSAAERSSAAVAQDRTDTAPLHPLPHRDTSDPTASHFSTAFTGAESFLAAHQVRGEAVLPAAAQLEMVRSAVAEVTGRDSGAASVMRLLDTVWMRPLTVPHGMSLDVHVELSTREDGAIGFEVRTGPAEEADDEKAAGSGATVHSRGTALTVLSEVPGMLDLDALRAACPTPLDPADAYADFHDQGLEYGPAMRGLAEIRLGGGELLAHLVHPGNREPETSVALSPAILDAALQASVVLLARETDEPVTGPTMPFALEQLDVHGPCAAESWAWVRYSGQPGGARGAVTALDIDICDARGTVSVRLRGLVQRIAAPVGVSERVASHVVTASTRWTDAPLTVPEADNDDADRRDSRDQGTDSRSAHGWDGQAAIVHGFLAGPATQYVSGVAALTGFHVTAVPGVAPDLVADGVDAVLTLVLGRVQNVLSSKPREPVRFIVLVDAKVPRHFHAPLVGLFRTAALENPLVSGRVVRVAGLDGASTEQIAGFLRQEAADPSAEAELRHRADGTRQAYRPVPLDLGTGPRIPPLKDSGVYWLTGGLGGLGRHVARYFARRANVTVVLSGRTARNDASDAALEELWEAGVDAHYLRADVSDAVDVEHAVRAIEERHGSLDGIVHAAGALQDAYLLHKDVTELPAVLDPKVRGVLHLDAASRDLSLDFFAVFSSVAGVYGNPGQADYAAANSFLDAFAHHRQALVDVGERAGRTVAVSWPLWADGGMTADEGTVASMRRRRGWEPLPTEEGLRVLGRVLLDGPEHVVVGYGAEVSPVPERHGQRTGRHTVAATTARTVPTAADLSGTLTEDDLAARATEFLTNLVAEVLRHDPASLEPESPLVDYGIDSLSILETNYRLEERFGPLPKTLFFEYLSIAGVVGYLVEEHRATVLTLFEEDEDENNGTGAGVGTSAAADTSATETETVDSRPPRTRDDYHDIAIIGVSGRYPGADTLDELWSLLEAGRDMFEEVPRDRWDHDAIYSTERGAPGKSVIRTGTFLRDIEAFDPLYFRISKRDAERMSPEVRLFLQAGVEALEDAGYSRETIQRQYNGDVGVLVGTMSNHYGLYGFQNSLTRGAPATGSYLAAIPNMLSYFYGFTGPSIFLDTMCSGSSTCVHQAVQMLRARECGMVVVGGVNLMLHPYNLITSSQEHFTTAASDVIRSFGRGADGTILGEGVGSLVLKPLVEAERDGDRIYAVIKGTGLSNAGARNGFTVPSPRMQARAIEKAIDDAGIDPRTISYLEGHGSGTALGDPIEVKALTTAFRAHTSDTQFCALGSVKSNLGHLLHAAGMAAFAKVILQIQKRTLAPSLHSAELSPDIHFADTPFRVQRELAPWKPASTTHDGHETVHPLRAGITSVGAGGMNSHIIVEEYAGTSTGQPPQERPRDAGGDRRQELFVVSAMTDAALATSLVRLRDRLSHAAESELPSLAYTLRVGKNELPRRWAFLAKDALTAVGAIDRYLAGDRDPEVPLAGDRDPETALAAQGADVALARELAIAWTAGRTVDWTPLDGPRPPRRVSLPAYPFERVRCWVEPEPGAPSVTAPLALRERVHPLLGRNESDVDGLRYGLDLRVDDLLDYAFRHDRVPAVVPTYAVESALAVAKVSGFANPALIRDLRLSGPVGGPDQERLITELAVTRGLKTADGTVVRVDGAGTRRTVAEFQVFPGDSGAAVREPLLADGDRTLRRTALHVLDRARVRSELAEGLLDYDPLYCGVDSAYRLPADRLVLSVTTPRLRHDHTARDLFLAPHVLAAVAQAIQLAAKWSGTTGWERHVPYAIEETRFFPGADRVAYVLLDPKEASIRLVDGEGVVVAELTGVRCGEPGATLPAPAQARSPRSGPGPAEEHTAESGADAHDDAAAAFVVDALRNMAAGILKFAPDELDVRTGFDAFGFDSISLVTFSKLVGEAFGIDLTPAVFFEATTLDALARYLLDEFGEPVRAAHRSSPPAEPESALTARQGALVGSRTTTVPARNAARRATAPGPTPIAVIGAAGRFPGSPDLDTYWSRLVEGSDLVTEFPIHRYDARYARIVAEAEFPRHAGVLDNVDAFDAGFFGIHPREAELMDPQHRLALETVWHALEDSGYTRAALPRDTGVFFGVSGTDYTTLLTACGVAPDAFTSTGNAHSMLANRISYVLDIRGPSQPVDTACSSSLVAVHRAMEAIRSGACEVAIAGGVNLLLSVDTFVSAHRSGMLSPDGRCKTFARDADGYVRGEGVGALLLKPLSAAERDGDAILGVLIGSAENHGGRANSLTAPNANAQAELVAAAMAGIEPDTIGYIETHGTGTALGDPVEVRALRSAYQRLGAGGRGNVGLGSVKPNIGHLEAAAGIAGLLKVLLAMKHGTFPATRNCQELNPYLPLTDGPFRIVRQNEPWQRLTGHEGVLLPRRAGVSSFGFGGANCHVVVEEYRTDHAPGDTVPLAAGHSPAAEHDSVVVPLSARTGERLWETTRDLLAHLEERGPESVPLRSLAWTLQTGREAMAERVGWVVSSHHELMSRLEEFVGGGGSDGRGGARAERGGSVPAGPAHRLLATWTEGADVDWRTLYGTHAPRRLHLPTYPFARERYWVPGAEPDRETPATAPESAAPAVGTALLVPRWIPRPAPTGRDEHNATRRVVILVGELAVGRATVEPRVPGARCFAVEIGGERLETRFWDLSRQVFEIVRDLVADPSADTTRVHVVVPASGDDAVNTALAGLARTAELEAPHLTVQVIGIDGGDMTAETVTSLITREASATNEGLVLHRDGVRLVPAWTEAPPVRPGVQDVPWRAGGVYLITGGASGIGAAVARRIARDVAGPVLVLAGRSPLDPGTDSLLEELRAAGAVAHYARADVSRWQEARHLVEAVRAREGGLQGIVHCAGVLHDAALTRKTAREWGDVLAPKTSGVVNLDRAVGEAPLDFLILSSSGAALTGNPGQADYATANAFLDAFATLRDTRVAAGRRSGRTLSVAWPLWREGGMTVDDAVRARLWRNRGLSPMETADGLTALVQAWRLGEERVWVHHGDLTRVPVTPQVPARQVPSLRVPSPDMTATVPAISPSREREALRQLLDLFSRVTGLAPDSVDADAQLTAAGLDSITVVQLNRELARTYSGISRTLFHEFPTLRAVALHLAAQHPSTEPVRETAPPRPESRPAVRPAPEASPREPIAIIGMSGRYPCAADLHAFWENLSSGRDCIREVPADRWPLDGFYEPDRATAIATGRSYSKWGGFLDDFAGFDPLFFRIAPRDAYEMDPQERLFLQASWQVLEDAGYTREEIARRHGRKVGVFAGVTKSGHARHAPRRLPSGEAVHPGLSFASLSARTSYVLDLHGPSMTIDTMCSASLTAIHEACEHLHQGSCEAAIAGGVNLYLHPHDYVELSRSNMLAAGSECRSFGSGGDGFVPGEGVGAVLLKPLSHALADGDRVLAVIRGTSVNHGGHSHGYTVPNPVAQAELVRDALSRAGVSARDVSYVEAHGTGTELGDPIEVAGLTRAFEQDTTDRQFCAIGSVKSAIGHLEAAAGIAGLTKVVLQMQHGHLVPSLHAAEPNPGIPFERTPFYVQHDLTPWRADRLRIASLSSFGAGGSNAHAVIEEFPEHATPRQGAAGRTSADTGSQQVVVLSARSTGQLRDQAARLAAHLDREGDRIPLSGLAFTLQTGREAMTERLALVVSSVSQLRDALGSYVDQDTAAPGVHRGAAGRTSGVLAGIVTDNEPREILVERWAAERNLDGLAALWCEGIAPDWHTLHGRDGAAPPQRISLPAYAFATDRYWIGDLAPYHPPAPSPAPDAVGAAEETARPPGPPGPPGPAPDTYVPQLVRAKLARALAVGEDEIDGSRAFAEYGLDSILGIRFVHELNEALSLDLTTSVLYDHSSADRLVTHLLDTHHDAIAPTVTAAPTAPTTPTVPAGARRTTRPPIAIVGMSGRFPGSDTLDELWDHLAAGHDLITEATRWDLAATDTDGNPRCTRGGFLDRIDLFDPLFFNISGVEARSMDPQQRLLLEESWMALEDAGYAGSGMGGRSCGVYVGCWNGDYQQLLGEDAPAQAFWGNMASLIPGRVSYFLDLKGPAIAVDTACSSSLVAIDLACKDLWSGETAMALAGGVFVQASPRLYDLAGRAGMLARTGRCHAFDHRAEGFVPGEGVGVLVLKRLDDALADGDHVHGVVRGCGTQHDGATNGPTAPSSVSQERLLREVYDGFGIDVETIQVVEAHGTGTRLGDPIEFEALTRAFRAGTDRTGYCALGSVKTNLGHTQFAAGVAGVFKILLGMRHGQIPASLHFERAGEAIRFNGSPFYPSTRTHPWEVPSGALRRGAVSSFGASGMNAHVVLEEASPVPRIRPPHPPYLVVLSARSREQLGEQVKRLAAHCRRTPGLDCGDIAYTLVVGREHFTERFACVVRDRTELIGILEEGIGGPRAYQGSVTAAGVPSADLRRGEEILSRPAGPAGVGKVATRRAGLEALAALYVRGAALAYARMFPQGAQLRVPLPTYPFARERHWAGPKPVPAHALARPGAEGASGGAHRGSLIANVTPVPGAPGTVRGSLTLTGNECYLRDHLVRGRSVLPGAVHVEMAREVAARALGVAGTASLRMRDITWARPLCVDGAPRDVEIVAEPVGSGGGGVNFRVMSESSGTGQEGAVVFCEGRVTRSGAVRPPTLDLAPLRAGCPIPVPAERIAKALVAMGVTHGPSLRAIEEAYAGPGTVVARLTEPATVARQIAPNGGGSPTPVLSPALLDSAIQASMALHLANAETGAGADTFRGPAVPFALDTLDLFAPCSATMWAVVRVADGQDTVSPLSRLDIDLVDPSGDVCVRMRGYTSRRMPESPPTSNPVPSIYAPVWEPLRADVSGADIMATDARVLVVGGTAAHVTDIARHTHRTRLWDLPPTASVEEAAEALAVDGPYDHLVWIAPDTAPAPTDAAALTAAQEEGVIAAYRLIKALLRTGYDARALGVTLVTRGALATHSAEEIRPAHAGLHGLFGSLAHEYGRWTVRRIDLEADGAWPQDLQTLPAISADQSWARRAGQWLSRSLAPCDTRVPARPAYRHGGVYVVIGGAGGLGQAWTRHLVERFGAHVVWLGRRERDASIDAKLRGMRGSGTVDYLTADASDPAAMRRAYDKIKARHGRVHGIVHAALVLSDQSLGGMEESAFRASVAAKVDTSVTMAEVYAGEPLDFILFFSSLQSFTSAAGQSNYAAGCAFADSYAHALGRHLDCSVKVMNWGWWGSVGSATSEVHHRNMARWSLVSIEPPEAMAALDTLLSGPQPQLGFVKLTDPERIGVIDRTTRTAVHPRAGSHTAAETVLPRAALSGNDRERELLRATAQWRRKERDPLLARMIRGHLEALGALGEPGTLSDVNGVWAGADVGATRRPTDVAEARDRAGIHEKYTSWLTHALRVTPAWAPPLDELNREWDEQCARWSDDPDKAAELRLADAALRALPDILSGRTLPTEVLFPRGSVELVEGVYRDNRLADVFNRAVSSAAADLVAQRLRREPAARTRILEIGAGTGGTSAALFAALRPHQDAIDTYTYTDLSKAFLNHARTEYGPSVPYLTCASVDVERPLTEQGIEAGSYDLVVAANVLHATRDIRGTLRNAKAALRDGGWLLLNEIAAFDVFSHLTFGLLEGWWLFEDGSLRVPGSPALSPGNWREVLHGEGFPVVVPVLPAAHELGQQVIAARSDGIVRLPATEATPRPAAATASRRPSAPAASAATTPTTAEVTGTLLTYLRDRAAETMDVPAEKIDATKSLTAYGMDSILVLQLANALRKDLGDVPSALLFELDCLERLAAHLMANNWSQVGELVTRLSPDLRTSATIDVSAHASTNMPMGTSTDESIGTLFTAMCSTGSAAQGIGLLTASARLRPTFATGEAGPEPETLLLADGGQRPALVCLPSLVAPTGPYQYLKFAVALRELRPVWTVTIPGYGADERLPQTLDSAVERQADVLRRRLAGRPYALVAYSSGGWLAHETVRRLEATGTPPAALVLIDSPSCPDENTGRGMATITRWLIDRFPHLPVDDAQLTAMAWYAQLLDGWQPRPVTTPTLFVGAAEAQFLSQVVSGVEERFRRPDWLLPHSRLEVPGHHFTLLEQHAESTALAIHQWLADRSQ